MKQNAVTVRKLKKAYGQKEVLKGVTLQVKEGSIFCLLGSNGAGKTTLVKILSTLIHHDEGHAEVLGYDVYAQGADVRRNISLTGQFAAVDEIMTGRENLEMIARLCHLDRPKEHALRMLKSFQLEDARNQRVTTYSGGMKRRLDIAMSLTGNPSLIFLDEPTTGLDPQSRNAMWNMIEELKANGKTIFLTTQYLEEAEQLADQVAILHEGVIIVNGSVADIKQSLSNEYLIFSFTDTKSLVKMGELFPDMLSDYDETALTVTLEISEGIEDITHVLMKMQQHGVRSLSFQQKKASLEDVFLHLVEQRGDAYA